MIGERRPPDATARPKPLISVSEAADLLGISRSVAYRWARLGCLPGAVRPAADGRWYVRRAPVLAFIVGDDRDATAPTPDELADARQQRAADHSAARGGA